MICLALFQFHPPTQTAPARRLYGEPYLEAVELCSLPVREYASIEDVPGSAWWAPPLGSGGLYRAVQATGAATLAEACQHAAVLDALLRAAVGLDQVDA